ncbi:MAG: 50S ribosomal protein L30e [Methanobacteriota archaeon]
MEVSRKVAQAMVTGKVIMGTDKSLKALKRGQARLVIVSSNCARETLEDVKHYSKLADTKFHIFDGDSTSLGLACGKPFSVDMLVVLDPGSSNILSIEGHR